MKWRCDGGVVEPATAGRPATVLIRLRPRADAHVGFLALKQQMQTLHRDLHERKILQGQLEIGLGDGSKHVFGPGDARLVEDTTGQGHTTRVVSQVPVVTATIPLAQQ